MTKDEITTPLPEAPEDIKPKLRTYFGAKVKWEGGKWLIKKS